MNKLTEKLRGLRSSRHRGLGFGALTAKSVGRGSSMLIGVQGKPVAGADFVLTPKPANGIDGDTLLGVEPEELTAQSVGEAEAAGAAFVVVRPASARADAMLSENLDYALRVPDEAREETELRALATLRPTLAFGPSVSEPLTLPALIEIRRLAMLLGAPLAVGVPADADDGTLEALRDSGVVALVLQKASGKAIKTLRERIANLPERKRSAASEVDPLVPGVVGSAAAGEDEEQDFPDEPF